MSELPATEPLAASSSRFGGLRATWRESAWFAVAPILLPMIVSNFLICFAMPLFVIGIGFVPVQVALLTVLLVFGPGPFWQRWWWHWGWAGVLYGSWHAGYYMWRPQGAVETIDEFMYGLPLFALVVQLPFWVARVLMGWRIVRRYGAEVQPGSEFKSPSEKLTVRHLLQAMAILAVTLGIARLGVGDGINGNPALDWFGLLIGSAMAMVVASFAVLPMMLIFSLEMHLESCWAYMALYAGFWIAVFTILFRNRADDVFVYVLIVTCFAVLFSAGLSRLRLNGFQIKRGQG